MPIRRWAVIHMTTTQSTSIATANRLLHSTLYDFIGPNQRRTLIDILAGEEGQWMANLIADLAQRIDAMPLTYEQDALGDQAIVHLHYFIGGCDWFITEKDMGCPNDSEDEKGQHQAFGLARIHEAELGYISIAELIENNVEINLHWTPRTIRQVTDASD